MLRAAYTENGVNFTDLGPITGSTSGTGNDSGSYNDVSNPDQQTSPSNTSPTNLKAGEADTTELRYIGSRGTIITNPDGSYGMFLSGSWATDGDSDAFNQIFYTTSTNGKEWSVPKVVLSTDYTFSASAAQDKALAEGKDEPLGISAYYSGRAYGPTVVQNPNGSLTMVFAGYRLPKPIEKAGTVVGTNSAARYTVGAKDPALYRNILTLNLRSSTSPGVATTTSVSSSDEGTGTTGSAVTYTAIVAPVAPGTGTPTGTVTFSNGAGPIAGCEAESLSLGSPDTASCSTSHGNVGGSEEITASYSGDGNYATSSGSIKETVDAAAAFTSANATTFTKGEPGSFTVTATGTPSPTITESGTLPEGVEFNTSTDELSGTPTQEGVFPVTFTASNGVGTNAVQHFTLTVDAAPVFTSASSTTFTEGAEGSFTVTATGTPAPTITESGTLPEGVTFNETTDQLSGTPTQEGVFPVTFTASNGVGTNAVQHFTLTVDAAPVFTSGSSTTFTKGSSGSFTVTATGTPSPTITKSGALPEGVTFNTSTDELTGTPTQEGVFPVTFTASNGVGTNAVQHFTLTVDAAPVFTSKDMTTFTQNTKGSFTVSASGTPAPTITESGTLPKGITFNPATDELSGTTSESGMFPITFTALNGVGAGAEQSFTLTVLPFHITTTSLPNATFHMSYATRLEAAGGVAPYKWKKISGKLPKGLVLGTKGMIVGRPTQIGTFTFTVTASDHTEKVHQTSTATLTLTVVA